MITRPNIIFSELTGVKYRQEICVPDIVVDMKNHKNIKLNVLNLYRVVSCPTTLPLCVEELEPSPISDVTLSVKFLRVKRLILSIPFVDRVLLYRGESFFTPRGCTDIGVNIVDTLKAIVGSTRLPCIYGLIEK